MISKRFGRLVVIEKAKSLQYKHGKKSAWKCLCDCGKTSIVETNHLKTGHTKSCGCMERKTHDMSYSKPYKVWANMKNRCENTTIPNYKNYGGRGIIFNPKWEKFVNFWNDMKEGYKKGLSIERIDNNKGYSKENCKWATVEEQQNNRRNNHYITYKDKTMNITQWAKELGIAPHILVSRITIYKWSIEKALTTSIRENTRIIVFNNEKKNLSQWARDKGIGKDTLWKRLKYGWSIKKALTTPLQK